MNNIDIGVVTIVYDGYGEFLMRWFGSIFKQTKRVKEIAVVLSKRHKFKNEDREIVQKMGGLLDINVIFIEEPDRKSIGELRNMGIERMNTRWILYFSADDILMDNAVEEIDSARATIRSGVEVREEADVVALRYYQECYYEKIEQETPIPEKRKMKDWIKNYRNAGYIAFKKSVWAEQKYDDNDYPNFPFMFGLVAKNKVWARTSKPCAIYLKRADSHSGRRTKKQNEEAYNTLDEAAKKFGI